MEVFPYSPMIETLIYDGIAMSMPPSPFCRTSEIHKSTNQMCHGFYSYVSLPNFHRCELVTILTAAELYNLETRGS